MHTQFEQFAADIGLNMKATFIRKEMEATKAPLHRWPHFLWSVMLERNGFTYTFEYRRGLAHVKPVPRGFFSHYSDRERSNMWLNDPRSPKAPSLSDVVAGLLLDTQCSEGTFEDFCGNFGYDTDSRKALETYLACQAAGSNLRRLLGNKFERVVELLADY